MGTKNDDGIKRPGDWSIRGKNDSVKREFTVDGQNTTAAGSKNRGGDKETPGTGRVSRNPSGDQQTPYGLKAGNNPSKRSADIGTGQTPEVTRGKNASSVDKANVKPRINSGKTKVHNYPAGRNRGRNFKG